MAHEITERDGLFTVREPAWHGLGVVLNDYPSIKEAKQLVHPWEPVSEPVYRKIPVVHSHTSECTEDCQLWVTEEYQEIPEFKAVVRDDARDGSTLGVVGDNYELVHNSDMYEIAEAIEGEADSGSVMLETGGSLKGGKKVWLLLRLRDPLRVKGDPNGDVILYYAIQNSHDSTISFRGQATMTRIVCDNTAQAADLDARSRGTEFSFRHTKNIQDKIEGAKAALRGWRESIENYQLQMNHLIGISVTNEIKEEFVSRFIPYPLAEIVTERVRENVSKSQQVFWDIIDGQTCEGIDDTAYGLVQASVEYLNHGRRTHTNTTRFTRNYLTRDKIVEKAVALVNELAGV